VTCPNSTPFGYNREDFMPADERDEEVFYARGSSACCGAGLMIVRSREDGFVTKNCTACGKPEYLRIRDFPNVPCPFCSRPFVSQRLDGTNYHFVCLACEKQVKVADVAPEWSEKFQRHGIAAFDEIENR